MKCGDTVRVLGEPKGSINEFAVVQRIRHDGTIWIANLNMPFCGTISTVVHPSQIEEIQK